MASDYVRIQTIYDLCYGEDYDPVHCPNTCDMWKWCGSECIKKGKYEPPLGTIWNKRDKRDRHGE